MADMSAVTPLPASEPGAFHAVETAWHALAVVQASVTSMEESAARIVAAELAGLIALWTQLFTFERAPQVLAWSAWLALAGALLLLAPVVTPRRLARFWTSMVEPFVRSTFWGHEWATRSCLHRQRCAGRPGEAWDRPTRVSCR